MKLKINKACDLSSISVLPPQSRRSSCIPVGPQQASQIRSQQSQQSFSQGFSSQHGMFSQISQTSLDEALTNDQRFSSQERENSVKKPSCLPVISYRSEDGQLPISRSSSNLIRNWSAAPVPDHKCQINEELHYRIGMMESSLTKFGMILDSVQTDVMQVKKGIKEVSLEMEGMLQKLIVLDTSLKLTNTGQEDVKFSLEGSLKSLSEQLSKDIYRDNLQQIFLVLSTLPKQIEIFLYKLQNELCTTFTKEIQAMACSVKTPLDQKSPSITVVLPKVTGNHVAPPRRTEPVKNPALPPKVSVHAKIVPKMETGGWKSVKVEQRSFTQTASLREQKRNKVYSDQQEKQSRVIIDSDEEIEGGFSCLIDVKETGIRNPILDVSKEETARILRKARRQKRKYCNPIIIN
ncbi:PREDICTED: protein PAIR1-like isoform X1 [Populus euphratica]|uniref:Protein PAIR1-like isoform X1 n=1 Tax=Populus euphratica TaxID=75702 RepID=A0AAJ6U637_POPEU|nr:PREDICTED: protein PAIR1-like isoform X1 [Populus euphratica]XP_011023328.1 PREDICTED: protein PAIR1-like isoform X1 [Populus euphratica]XP_011023329.1 PREDICTED: protein PAIR1-like isoform X1 [Populus euphratica]